MGAYIGYFISATLTLIVGYLLWLIKRERKSLVYQIDESEYFPQGDKYGKYFNVYFINNGNREIENVDVSIAIPVNPIDSYTFSDKSLFSNVKKESSNLFFSMPLINPKEKLKVTIVSAGSKVDGSLKVSARGKGVTAIKQSADYSGEIVRILTKFVPIFALAVMVPTITSLIIAYDQKSITSKLDDIEEDAVALTSIVNKIKKSNIEIDKAMAKYREQRAFNKGNPRTEQIVFALFNKASLTRQYEDLMSYGELSYWKTGYFLTKQYASDSNNRVKYISAMELLIDVDMNPSSKGFLLYLLAKMEKDRGNKNKAIEYLDRCKSETPLMYDHLMSQDPAFNLKDLH